jgi:hypothetical protein
MQLAAMAATRLVFDIIFMGTSVPLCQCQSDLAARLTR